MMRQGMIKSLLARQRASSRRTWQLPPGRYADYEVEAMAQKTLKSGSWAFPGRRVTVFTAIIGHRRWASGTTSTASCPQDPGSSRAALQAFPEQARPRRSGR